MKKLLLAALVGFAQVTAMAQTDGAPCVITHNGVDYTLTTRWIDKELLKNCSNMQYKPEVGVWWNTPVDFIVKNDVIYFTRDAADNQPSDLFLTVDGTTHQVGDVCAIDYGDINHTYVSAVYAGTDGAGTYFAAAYGRGHKDYPIQIFPLEFDASGQPKAMHKYEITVNTNWYTQNVWVGGDLLSGNFTVVALLSNAKQPAVNDASYQTGLSVSTFSNGVRVNHRLIPFSLSVCDMKVIDDDHIIIHDRHYWTHLPSNGANTKAEHPTMYQIGSEELLEQSVLAVLPEDDGMGNGMAFFTLGDSEPMMVYASSGMEPEFKLMAVPDYPRSFDGAYELGVITPKSVQLSTDSPNTLRGKTRVFIEKPDDNTANIFVSAQNQGMAAYALTREDDDNPVTGITAVSPDSSDAPEYYTLTGIRLSAPPATGCYIVRRGSDAKVSIVR